MVIINITSLVVLNFFYSQIIRLVSSILFFLLFFMFNIKDKLLIAFTVLLIIADVVDLYYLKPLMIETFSVIKMLAFSLLTIILFKKNKSQRLEKVIASLFLMVIIINILIGYKAIDEASNLLAYSQLISIQVYWIVCVLAAALAAKYYFLEDSNKAVYFVAFTFMFVFADLSGFIASFFKVHLFYFFERILYYLGFMCLGYYLFFLDENNNKDADFLVKT